MVKTVCEIFTRTVGYLRPIYLMNDSKQAEVGDRIKYSPTGSPLSQKYQTTI